MRQNIQSEEQVAQYQNFNNQFGNIYKQLGSVKEEQHAIDSDAENEMMERAMQPMPMQAMQPQQMMAQPF